MGVVLLGRHATLERRAVLKRLRPELAVSDELVERFAREARAAAAVHHQNVVAVYDWISWRGEHYIAQEYVDGVDLRAALAKVGRAALAHRGAGRARRSRAGSRRSTRAAPCTAISSRPTC